MTSLPQRLPPAAVSALPMRAAGPGLRRLAALFAGAVAAVAFVTWPVVLAMSLSGAAVVALSRTAAGRRRRRARHALELRQLPTVIAFAQLAVAAGFAPRNTLSVLGRFIEPPAADRWRLAAESIRGGASFTVALDAAFADAPDDVARLPHVLDHADRTGVELTPVLARLADDVRRQRMADLDERAQRLSVRLLFPLVFCLLPAFVLLSMVPLAVGLLADLPW